MTTAVTSKKDYFSGRHILYWCFIVALITLSIFNLSYFVFLKPQTIYRSKSNLSQKINFWNNFLYIHPTYLEGWIQLSQLELKNGNVYGAQVAFLNARKIDPNSSEVLSLESELRGSNSN